MMIGELVFSQAKLLAGELEAKQERLLEVLCNAAVSALASRLREGLRPEDCKADFVAAASLHALASLGTALEEGEIQEFKAGDLSVKQSGTSRDAASRCLQKQAEMLMEPYLRDGFVFAGV